MDPLSLSASIAGLISLAQPIFTSVYRYGRAVKDARSDVQQLAQEINGLMSILLSLQALALDLEADGTVHDPTLRAHHLHQFTETMAKIKQRVEKANNKFNRSTLEGAVARLKWPFSSGETKALLDDLARHKLTITMALTADSMRKMQLSLSQDTGLGKAVSAMADAVRRIEINTQIIVDDKRQRVLDFFMKFSPQPNLEMSIRLRHPMTGLWLTDSPDFTCWLACPGSKMWLSGIPGMGKTVLAGAVIQEALTRSYTTDNIGAAFFFCDYKNNVTWDSVNILGAIASQLARQKIEAFAILQAYYDELHPENGLVKTPNPEELRAKIGEMSELLSHTMIVVDGLDECGDTENTDDVVIVLQELATNHSKISMALFSRDHDNIRELLEPDFQHVRMAANTKDIELYVSAELTSRIQTHRLRLSSVGMRDEIAETLVNRADGMFRWVVCQIDYLCECAHDGERREALMKLPPDLPESYRRLLVRVQQSSPAIQIMVQKCLLVIAYASPKLNILELRQVISTPDEIGAFLSESSTISEHEISRRCSSMIRKSQDGNHFEFAHFSVQEFLEDRTALLGHEQLDKFFMNREIGKRTLDSQSLRFVQLKNFDTQLSNRLEARSWAQERTAEFPFYHEAALRCAGVLIQGLEVDDEDDADVWALAISLFRPQKTSNFTMWALEIIHAFSLEGRYSEAHEYHMHTDSNHWAHIEAWDLVSKDMFTPLHVAAALNSPELCSYLLEVTETSRGSPDLFGPLDLAVMTFVGLSELRHVVQGETVMLYRSPRQCGWPSLVRRNRTFDLLFDKTTTMSNQELLLDQYGLSLFSITCILAVKCIHDLSPIITMLATGTIPSASDLDTLEKTLKDLPSWDKKQHSTFEESSLRMLMQLKGTFSCRADWGFRMSSIIWTWAIKGTPLGYTKNPLLADPRITMSQEALTVKALSAVEMRDNDALNICLADERLDLAHMYEASDVHKGGTLLHIACGLSQSKYLGIAMVEALLGAGSDTSLHDEKGCLCLHRIQLDDPLSALLVIKSLRARGVDISSGDTNGSTIWHYLATQDAIEINTLVALRELDCEASKAGLLAQNHDDNTPLLLLLQGTSSSESITQSLELIRFSSKFEGFWDLHPPVLGAAARFGSGEIVRCLLELNAYTVSTREAGPCTPLHQLGVGASLECLELLQPLYPGATDSELDGCLPIELFLRRLLMSSKSGWGLECQKLETTEALIKSMQQWSRARESPTTIRFLKRLIDDGNSSFISMLMKHGVDVHQRVDGMSSLEHACQPSLAYELGRSQGKRASLSHLLDHARIQQLNEVALAGPNAGLGLLHGFDNYKYDDISWLASELVSRGVDVNARFENPGTSLLMYYISRDCFDHAAILLDLGADPTIVPTAGCDPIQCAVINKSSAALRKILKLVSDYDITISWNHTFSIQLSLTEMTFRKVNNLHLASLKGAVECLNFFLNEHLISDINATSAEGYTCLHFAAFGQDEQVDLVTTMKILLSQGADIFATSHNGTTPLHVSAQNGFLSGVKLLVEHGAVESLDAYMRSPLDYAVKAGHGPVVQYLESARSSSGGDPSASKVHMPQQKRLEYLAQAFENAIDEGDLQECKRLVAEGCPVDVEMLKRREFSPLVVALRLCNVSIATWLLENGASALKSVSSHDHRNTVEFAAGNPARNSVLPLLLATYMSQGGDLIQGDEYPFHWAVWRRNTEGIELLLRSIGHHKCSIAKRGNIPVEQVVPVIINRRESAHTIHFARTHPSTAGDRAYTASMTALHLAVWQDDQTAISLLVNNGALIDAPDNHGLTPLAYADTRSVAEYLLRLGASPTALLRLGTITSLISWWGTVSSDMLDLFFGSGSGFPAWKLDGLIDLTLSGNTRMGACENFELSPEDIEFLAKAGADFIGEDPCGRSLMHSIICSESAIGVALRDLPLERTTPFPWHLDWTSIAEMAFLTSKFDLLREKLPSETFLRILNLEPQRGWSPLCRAAARGLVNVMENCLSMKAAIDFEGSPLGSALALACACGSLEAVKCLIQHGAAVSYTGSGGTSVVCALTKTRSASIRTWLLVGRFTEIMSIAEEGFWPQAVGSEMAIRPWSGIVQAKVALTGKLERWNHESLIMYVGRLEGWKRSRQGIVIQAYDGSAFLVPGDI